MRGVKQSLSMPDYTFHIKEFRLVIKTAFMGDSDRESLVKTLKDYIDERFYYLSVNIERHTDHFHYCGDTSSESDKLFRETSTDGSETRFDITVISFSLPRDNPDRKYYSYKFEEIYKDRFSFMLPREAALGMVREVTDLVMYLIIKSGRERFTFYGIETDETEMDQVEAHYLFVIKDGLDFYDDKGSEAGVFTYLDRINKNWYKVMESSKVRDTLPGIWRFNYNLEINDRDAYNEFFFNMLDQRKEEPALEVTEYWNNHLTFLSIPGNEYYTIIIDKEKKQLYLEKIIKYHESIMNLSRKYKLNGSLRIADFTYIEKPSWTSSSFNIDSGELYMNSLYRNGDNKEIADLKRILNENLDAHP